MNMLEIIALEKSFGKFQAVQPVDLAIPEGEFFSLLGPSGCGKTTLLRMLGGFEAPTSGEIRQSGVRIDILPPNRRQFNMVFQRYALFPHLNLWENVAFGLRMKRVAAPELRTRVSEMLALVKLDGMEDRPIATLSGGQQQRVALARALVNRPKILLLDEPLSALDLKLRQQMQVELKALQRRLGHTFIFVTHDQEEALTLSDRIAVMNQGRIEQVGTPEEIYENPRTLFAAKFIGSINLFAGKIEETREGVARIRAGSVGLSVSSSKSGMRTLPALAAGSAVHVLVRPEKIYIEPAQAAHDAETGPLDNRVRGVLKEILYQGAVTQFVVESPDFPQITFNVSRPNARLDQASSLDVSDAVMLRWSPEDSVLMPAESEMGAR